MRFKVLFALYFFAVLTGCRLTPEKDWMHDSKYWLKDGDAIIYKGNSVNTVAWIDKKIKENTTIEFKWKVESEDNNFELIIILFGNGALKGDFWADGIVLNYLSKGTNNLSWIRLNGIYDKVVFVNGEDNVPYFNANKEHTSKITYDEGVLSYYIDDTVIQNRVLVRLDNTTGYFGVANYWENKDLFTISDVRIH